MNGGIEVDNMDRAERALKALKTYQGTDFQGAPLEELHPEDALTLVQDLIGDLLHAADLIRDLGSGTPYSESLERITNRDLLDWAEGNYQEEVKEEAYD